MSEWISQLDRDLFFLINRGMENSLFDLLMPVITSRAYIIILPFLLLYLLVEQSRLWRDRASATLTSFLKERKRALIIFALSFFSIMVADGLSNALKHIIGRERPCNVLNNVHLLVGCTKSFSMPSNHASNAFAFAIPFFLSKNPLRYLFLFLAILISISRVYVGVHYPLDVAVGSIVGTIAATGVIGLYKWASKRFHERPYFTLMALFLLGISLFRFYYILHGPLDLSPDEAHYWEWSRRLDLSYYSKGPMIAYLIAISTSLFGDNVFGVRFFAVVFSLLSSIYLYKLGREMYDERVGTLSAVILQIIPLYSAFGVIFTIDSPFIFFWIISLYIFWRAISARPLDPSILNPPNPPLLKGGKGGFYSTGSGIEAHDKKVGCSHLASWVLLGLTIGLGLLTKYTMAFFYLCAFLFILKERSDLLKRPAPYIALIVGLVVFSPVVIWNAQHGWVTVRHTAGQAHIGEGLSLSIKSLLEFVVSQIGVLTPILSIMLIMAVVNTRRDGERGRFIFWFSLPIIVFFILKSLHGKVQANWAMTGYITGIIGLSNQLLSLKVGRQRRLKVIGITGIAVALALTVISHYPPSFLPVKLDPSSRLKGWKELGEEVSMIYDDMRKERAVFIFSDRYQVSSELAFYVRGNPVTYCVNLGRRMNQYDLWPGFNHLMHYDAIFVTIGRADLPARIGDAFDRCDPRVFEARKGNRVIREYSIFSCYDFKGMEEERIRSY